MKISIDVEFIKQILSLEDFYNNIHRPIASCNNYNINKYNL